MNLKSTLIKCFSLALLFTFSGNIDAQIFWSEDFADGMPTGWTTEDPSPNEALWTYCPDPPAVAMGCSPIFDDAINLQVPFAATTASNGCMTVNSDLYNSPASDPHISQLTTTPIDCSMEPAVFIRFENHIGVFDLDADGNALLQVSVNGTDWTDYNCFPGLIPC